MEKIQAAIARARASRRDMPEAPSPHPARAVVGSVGSVLGQSQPGAAPAAAHQSPWDAIPPVQLSKQHLKNHRIVTFGGAREEASFDALRTRLLQQIRASNWRRVAITSPSAGTGKSTLVMNLAFSLSHQPDQKTIVTEMDFRRPSMSRILGIRDELSLVDVLEGTASFESNARRFGQNLLFSTQSRPVQRPAELLQSDRTGAALDSIQKAYDPTVMLFDMPPMKVDDTIGFMRHVDAVILVAAAEKTTVQQIDLCERELAGQTNVLGVVLNKCRYMPDEAEYGYY